MEKHKLNIIDKIITPNMFHYDNFSENITLKTKIVTYYNGIKWIVVPLDILLSYPIIHDFYYDAENDKKISITIAVCPFTLAACAFEGEYRASDYVLNSCLVITNNNTYFPIITGNIGDDNKIKRWELEIKLFRNAISDHPDLEFLILKSKSNHPVLDKTYYVNDKILYKTVYSTDTFHPKTLVYLVQYKSSKTLKDKYTILVGHDASSSEPTGYNLKKSKLYDYIEKIEFKLREKSGFMIPLLWFSYKSFFPNAKIVYL